METLSELQQAAEQIGLSFADYKIAVAGLIFCNDGRVLLEKRGHQAKDEQGSLEGVGGNVGGRQNLHKVLQDEIGTELHDKNRDDLRPVRVSIEQFLDFQALKFKDAKTGELRDWIVATYLCRLQKGSPVSGELEKVQELKFLTLDELYNWPAEGDPEDIPEEKRREPLSPWTVHVRAIYKERHGNRPFFEHVE